MNLENFKLTKKIYLILYLMLSFFILPKATMATIILGYSQNQMVELSVGIVDAKVLEISSFKFDKHIFTQIKLEINESLKGPFRKGQHIKLDILGGQIGNEKENIHGSPKFILNERVLLYLERIDNRNVVLGMSFGKFSITSGINPWALRDSREISLAKPNSNSFEEMDIKKYLQPILLKTLKEEIKSQLKPKKIPRFLIK